MSVILTGMTRSMTGVAGVLVLALAAGCGGGEPKDQRGQVREACEHYVKDRLRQQSAKFTGEQVDIGPVRTRASMKGYVRSGGSSRQWFLCSVEKRQGGWNLVTLAGV